MKIFNYYTPGWGGIFALFGLFLLGSVLGGICQMFINSMPLMYFMSFVPMIIFVVCKSISNKKNGENPIQMDRNGYKPFNFAQIGLKVSVATLTTAIAIEPLMALLPQMPDSLRQAMEMLTGGPIWISLLTASIMAPLFEEWLCRGLVLRGLLQKMHPAAAIFISAAFFALIHMNPWQAIPAFIIGSLMGLVYYKTGSLKLTMLMHCVNNTFSVILSNIPAFKDKDYLFDVMGKGFEYYALLIICFCMVALFLITMKRTEFSEK